MKRILLTSFIALISLGCLAQTAKDELAVVQTMYGVEKRKLVTDYMKLPEAQATSFWSVYDDFEVERRALGKERFELIGQYADNFASLTDAKADEIAKGLLANTIKYDKLNEAYYNKIKKVTSAVTAAKFMQLEVYLQNQVKSEISETIPFLGEIEKTRTDN